MVHDIENFSVKFRGGQINTQQGGWRNAQQGRDGGRHNKGGTEKRTAGHGCTKFTLLVAGGGGKKFEPRPKLGNESGFFSFLSPFEEF